MFIFGLRVYFEGIRVIFVYKGLHPMAFICVYKGHRVKVKVKVKVKARNPYSRNVKLRSAITRVADRSVWSTSLSRNNHK